MTKLPIGYLAHKDTISVVSGVLTILSLLSDKDIKNGIFKLKDNIFGNDDKSLSKIDKNLFFNLERDYIKNSKGNVSIDSIREQLVKAAIEYIDSVKTNCNKFDNIKK